MSKLKCERFYTNPGSRFRIEYDITYDRSGRRIFRESGKVDIQEEINSFESSCDLSAIVKMMDTSDTSGMFYGDFTVPFDEFKLKDVFERAREAYEESEELKSKYTSFDDFVSAVLDNGCNLEKSEPDKHENAPEPDKHENDSEPDKHENDTGKK